MNDLISRQAVLKELPHALWGKEWDEALAKAIIESAPTIDPVEYGEWAYSEIRDYPIAIDRVGCTNCGWRFYSHPAEKDDQHRADRIATSYRYCPMCGARMNL